MDIARLKRAIEYDSSTGLFRRKLPTRGVIFGVWTPGYPKSHGYFYLGVDREQFLCHRLAWAISYEEWPTEEIDHINRNKADNRLENLRVVSKSLNRINTTIHKNNSTGFLGVTRSKEGNRFVARIAGVVLGTYATAEEAGLVVEAERQRICRR